MTDVISVGAVVVLGISLTAVFTAGFSRAERMWLLAACALHLVAAVLMVWITRDYYGYGDMLAYHRTGSALAIQVTSGNRLFTDVLAMLLHQPNGITGVHGNGWSTGTMHAIAAVLALGLNGSLMASCMLLSLISFSGKVALWSAMMTTFPTSFRWPLFAACLLFPSAVFWTAGILKESVALAGLGWLVLGLSDLYRRRARPLVLLCALVGASFVALTKAYVLFAFVIAAAVAFWVQRVVATRSIARRVVSTVGAGVGGVALVAALGVAFPRYSTANLAEEMTQLRELGRTHAGGSTIVDDATAVGSGHLIVGLATALFRPLVFEVRNPLMLVSAAETSLLLGLVVLAVRRRGFRGVMAVARTHAGVAFCLTFTLVFAIGVGASSTNLGTLSRYRVPMIPFYAALAFTLARVTTARVVRSGAVERRSNPRLPSAIRVSASS